MYKISGKEEFFLVEKSCIKSDVCNLIVIDFSGSSGVMLIIWVAGGVVAILGGLVWCELALTFPNLTANEYSYVYEAFGPFPAFVVTYTAILTKSSSCTMMSLVAGDYITTAAIGEAKVGYSKGIGAIIIGNIS